RECGVTGSVYFVDDNFIGNRKAALDLLPHLIEWQKRTGYVMRLACEATLNIAKRPEILEKMREAFFVTIFCGIETPDPDALQALPKTPLWDRLEREGRLVEEDEGRDSNVAFLLPYEDVVSSWRKCMEVAYAPEKLYARYQYQCEYTYTQRLKVPVTPEQKS